MATARLRLRELIPADAPFLLEVLNEPAFLRNVGDRGVRTIAQAESYLQERIISSYERFGFGTWLVELTRTGEPAGICGLIKRPTLEDVDIGFSFLERFRGRGLAHEAARAVLDYGWRIVKLTRILAIVAPHNAASIKLVEKLGFTFEKMIQLSPGEQEVGLWSLSRK